MHFRFKASPAPDMDGPLAADDPGETTENLQPLGLKLMGERGVPVFFHGDERGRHVAGADFVGPDAHLAG